MEKLKEANVHSLEDSLVSGEFHKLLKVAAVVDGYLSHEEIGPIDVPIILNIKKGNVVEISGCPSTSNILNQWLKGQKKEVIHFLIGFNPGANLSRICLEAERVFGHFSIGFCNFPFHTDCVIKDPTILLDDKIVMQDGSFTHEKLSILEKGLIKEFLK